MKTIYLLLFLLMSSIQVFSQTYKKEDKVEIEYSGTWYPGYILETKDAQYKIHYDAYDSSWDEWVPTSRLRSLAVNPTTNTNTKVEETKQVEQKSTEVAVQEKKDTKIISASNTFIPSKKTTYYSSTKTGEAIDTFYCQKSPKELWVHFYVPEEAFKYDKLEFSIYWKFNNNPKYTDALLDPWWEYKGRNLEELKKDPWVHIQILDPESKNFFWNDPKKPTYKAQAGTDYWQMCKACKISTSFNCKIAGVYKTGTKDVWKTKYTDGSGDGWWEKQDIYGEGAIIDNFNNKDDELVIILK